MGINEKTGGVIEDYILQILIFNGWDLMGRYLN